MRGRTGLLLAVLALAGCNQNEFVAGAEASPTPTATPPDIEPPEYLGKEFFAVDLDNIYQAAGPLTPESDAAGAQFAVTVANPDAAIAANVTVSNATGTVQTATVAPGALHVFELPRADVDGTSLAPVAYRIESDRPVTAHQFNPLGNVLVYSNDASLLLPTSALGDEYRAMAWPQSAAGALPGFVAVVAIAEGPTSITVTPSAATVAGGSIPALAAGQTFTQTLNRFEVLALQTGALNADLSGTAITSDERVAVFAGAECAYVPLGVTACDHLEEQMIPVASWGKTYVAGKSKPRGTEPDVWRVMASVNGTTVTTDPLQPGTPATLAAGEVIEFETEESFVIVAGAPVQVGQYLVGQDYGFGGPTGFTGDPAFIVAVPVEQFRTEYLFLTPPNYAHDSITIVGPTGVTATLDGAAVAGFQETSPGSGWSVVTLTVSDGVHRLQSSEPVGLTVTGYDQYVSYGYPGGLNLSTLPE